MQDTLEVRWFIEGTPPTSVVEWIEALGATRESARTDLYLVSDDPAMNVKLREGQVQTKHRMGSPSPVDFPGGVSGQQERWVKWGFPTEEQHHDLFDDDPTGLWVPVNKERRRLSVPPEAQADLLDHLIESDPVEAKIELTEVTSGEHEAWTICVESEGRPDALPGTLQQMGRHFFQQGTPPALSADDSYGYARWIHTLAADATTA